MQLNEDFADVRDEFEVVAFHDASVQDFDELDEKLAATKRDVWGGRDLPFPELLDATGETIGTWDIREFPTLVLIDPDGNLVPGDAVQKLEAVLRAARREAEAESGSVTPAASEPTGGGAGDDARR